jgi:hypothetical protein
MAVVAIIAVLLSAGALVASIWAARSARDSAQAAEISATAADRAQRDRFGPNVVIDVPKPLRGIWMRAGNQPDWNRPSPALTEPVKTQFVLPLNEGELVLVGAYLTIRNEGDESATVQVGADRVDRCDDPADIEATLAPSPSLAARPDPRIPDGRIALRPREQAGVIVRHGPTIAEWEHDQDRSVSVSISAEASLEGPRQSWQLTIEGSLLNRVYGDASRYAVASHALPTVTLTRLARQYPTST